MPDLQNKDGQKPQTRTVSVDPEGNLSGIDTWLEASGFKPSDGDGDPAANDPAPADPDNDPNPDPDPNVNPNEPTPAVRKVKIKVQGQELEVPETELVSMAQMGLDYTQKTQRLAERERALAPMEGVVRQIQGDPKLRQLILDYWNGVQSPPAPAAPQIDPAKANDPVEILKAEILAQVRNELLPEVQRNMSQTVQQAVNAGVAPIQQDVTIAQTMQKVMTDPLYNQVQQSIGNMVRQLPRHIGEKVFHELDTNPQAYMDAYMQHRQAIATRVKSQPGNLQPTDPPGQQKRIAPLLESSGGAPPPSGQQDRKKRSEKAKAALLKSGDVNALSNWLQESGALDHIRLDEEE